MTTLNPYLSFKGEAREAMTFYQSVFGGDLTVSTFGESGMSDDPATADQVMHAQLEADGLTLMGADTPEGMPYNPGDNVAISLSGPADDEQQLRGYWDRLSEGAQPGVPLEKAPWGDYFGMLTDRFGIGWMVNIAGAQEGTQA
jgi:PhnB protein